jgi:hypothetical protein
MAQLSHSTTFFEAIKLLAATATLAASATTVASAASATGSAKKIRPVLYGLNGV